VIDSILILMDLVVFVGERRPDPILIAAVDGGLAAIRVVMQVSIR